MADISITPSGVTQVSGGTYDGIAGATITAGQVVYLDATDANKLKLAVSDVIANVATASIRGVALHASLAGQPLRIATSGVMNIGATVVLGGVYVLSVNAGGIAPVADLASTKVVSLLGIANTVGQLTLNIINSGIAHA